MRTLVPHGCRLPRQARSARSKARKNTKPRRRKRRRVTAPRQRSGEMAPEGALAAICVYEQDVGESGGAEASAEMPPSGSGAELHEDDGSSSWDSDESFSSDQSLSSAPSASDTEAPNASGRSTRAADETVGSGLDQSGGTSDREAVRASANASVSEQFWQERTRPLESDADPALEWHMRPPPPPTEQAKPAHVWIAARSLSLQKKRTKCRGPMRFVAHDVILRIGDSERLVPSAQIRLLPPERRRLTEEDEHDNESFSPP